MSNLVRSLVVLAAAAVASAAAASSAAAPTGARPSAESRLHAAQAFAFTIRGRENGGEVVSPLGNIAIAPGVPVRITVTNFTREFHTFTVPGLHVSRLILPAHDGRPRQTTFTFTSLHEGRFAWYCAICVGGGHKLPHEMGGTVWVIVDPSVVW